MRMLMRVLTVWALCALTVTASADIIVNYTVDAGGHNTDPLNGLAARATFSISGSQLGILLENTSTGVPLSFDVSDSLLVSLGMNLPTGVFITAGNSAVIGPGSTGLGAWSSRGPGASVAEEWLWTNDFGGDVLEAYAQIISTSAGQGGGTVTRFDLGTGTVEGPYGGIAAAPPLRSVPGPQPAVSDSILFDLMLNTSLTELQLAALADASIVEFGSDQRYLMVPEPASTVLALIGLAMFCRRR